MRRDDYHLFLLRTDRSILEIVRILQHRSVAFVTYDDELHGQFAKEAMACQSLDNDEILNVRCVKPALTPDGIVVKAIALDGQQKTPIQPQKSPKSGV